jgi:hypothetical protein
MRKGRARINYPPKLHPTMLDIAWAAGFYEGEGCCTLSQNQLCVFICQRQKEPLLKMELYFGGKIYSNNTKTRDAWIYHLKYERAYGFLYTIFPFLSREKRDQIKSTIRKREIIESITDENKLSTF